jgi:alpha-tubulin suppressor-like RCC1 family protein
MSQIRCRSAWSWRRLRLGVVAAAVLLVSGMVGLSPAPTALASTVTTGGFTSLAPSRLLDTRIGVGAIKAAAVAGGTVHLQVAGRGGVPASGVSAVVLNVTVTAPATAGFLTVYGDGTALPGASNLNFVKSQSVPNLVIAPVGANGKVALFNGSGGTVQLVADVSGYYLAGDVGGPGKIRPGTTAAGSDHSCAVTTGGGVKCWGYNEYGKLGDGTTTYLSNVPVAVVGLDSGVASVTAGYYHSCALTTTGGVKCWGHNSSGQLGDGTNNDSNVPVDVVGLGSGVAFLSSGSAHTCAVTTGGGVKCWGYDVHGQLGDGAVSDSSVPVDVVGLSSGVSSVAAGAEHSCAVTTIGALKCWGGNYFGQLGDGTTGYPNMPTDLRSSVPVGVVGLASGVVSVAAGYADSCAVTTSGALKCWGYNYQGELGNGTLGEDRAPTDVIGLGFGVASVSLGSYHTCAVTTGGAVKCWGDNPSGQLGRDSIGGSSVPWDVVGLTDIAAVSAGGAHTCVVTTGGGMKCFGRNSRGQLGDGTDGAWISNRGPVDVIGLGSGTVAVPAG